MNAPQTIANRSIGTRILAQRLLTIGLQPVAVAALTRVYAAMSIQGETVKVEVIG